MKKVKVLEGNYGREEVYDSTTIKKALSYELGSDLHTEWCMEELKSFYKRFQEAYNELGNYGEALRKACYKNGTKRNECELDVSFLVGHDTYASSIVTDFNAFINLFKMGAIEVKRYTKRKLTEEETHRTDIDYVDGKENILREFKYLSVASQKDNLEAAAVAISLVYDKVMNGEEITEETLDKLAAIVHEEWLKRNDWVFDKEYGNPTLAVPYFKLPEDEKEKDRVQLKQAISKVQQYINGNINIEEIITKYSIKATTNLTK